MITKQEEFHVVEKGPKLKAGGSGVTAMGTAAPLRRAEDRDVDCAAGVRAHQEEEDRGRGEGDERTGGRGPSLQPLSLPLLSLAPEPPRRLRPRGPFTDLLSCLRRRVQSEQTFLPPNNSIDLNKRPRLTASRIGLFLGRARRPRPTPGGREGKDES